jgi:sigma-B regulation protein RsbU (phosphoserine phosphatase)
MIVADVMGSGLPAALFASRLRDFFRTFSESTLIPSEIMSRINKAMFDELSVVDTFITAQVLALNTRTSRLTMANAGHCPGLLTASHSRQVVHLAPDGLPLGIFPDSIFPELNVVLQPGVCALLYTDGIPEATNSSGEFFGHDYLETWFAKAASLPHTAASLQHQLKVELDGFQGYTRPHDDQTAVVLVSS